MKTFLRLIRYLLPYRLLLVLVVLLAFFQTMFTAVVISSIFPFIKYVVTPAEAVGGSKLPRLLRTLAPDLETFVRRYLPEDRFHAILLIVVVFFFAALLSSACRFLLDYIGGYVSNHATRDLLTDLHDRILFLSLRFFQKTGLGQILSRFTTDVAGIGNGLKTIFERLPVEPLNASIALAFCFFEEWRLTLLVLVVFPLTLRMVSYYGKRVKQGMRKSLDARARVTSMLEDVFGGIRIVKVFVMEAFEQGRFRETYRRYLRQLMKVIVADAATGPLVDFSLILASCFTLVAGGYLVVKGRMEGAALIWYFGLLASLQSPLKKMGTINNVIQMTLASAERIFLLMDVIPEEQEVENPISLAPLKNEIRYERVHFAYEPGLPVLKGIDLVARRGEIVAFVGPSGVGKTTLVHLLPRFFDPSEGRVSIDGVDIRQASLKSLRGQIGMVTQETVLFDETLVRNISYGRPEASFAEIVEAAKAANAYDFIQRLPDRFETRIGADGVELSGGERQRIALARAVVKNPPILILDEATSSVDSESERLIQEALDRFVRGRTTFVIAHRLSTVQKADKIVVMKDGTIEMIGKHVELLSKSPTYRLLYERQFAPFEEPRKGGI